MAKRKSRQSGTRPPLVPNNASLQAILDRLSAVPNVVGCFVGYKRKGRRKTKRLAIVCCVTRKIPRSQLRPADRLPRMIRWTEGRRFVRKIPTDVQEWGASGRQAFFAGPADALTHPVSGERATVGVAVDVPALGPVLTTAAHAIIPGPGEVTFGANPPSLTLSNIGEAGTMNATVKRATWTDAADFALLALDSGAPTNLFEDRLLVSAPFFPLPGDIGRAVFCLTSRGMIPMRYEGGAASIPVGGFPVTSALLATALPGAGGTKSGDSGCCLVDDQFRLWGLLVGFASIDRRIHSVFQSPAPLFRTGARLI